MDSIYAKRSASALRVKTQGTEHRLMYALGGTLLSAAFCLLCYAASEWRTTKGVASGGTNLVDGITSSMKLPRWLIWAADIGDQLIAYHEWLIYGGIVLLVAYVLRRNRDLISKIFNS